MKVGTKRGKQTDTATGDLLDVTARLRTAPCVPALRVAVKAWRAGGYKGTTETTRRLLAHWFATDHRLPNGDRFAYHSAQREAIETLIFVWEYERVRSRRALLERYASPDARSIVFPPGDPFPRYAVKMATGSGKTKVMSLAIAWQFLNASREKADVAAAYARTFLVIAPNVIVLERLKSDFAGGLIFRSDPVMPRDLEASWDFDCVVRGDGERGHHEGTLFLTNIDQLYDRTDRTNQDEPAAMIAMLGARPPTKKLDVSDFRDRIALRSGHLLVLNDEGHHTHDDGNEWNNVIRALHATTPLTAQLDFSATPRFLTTGALFPWTISDYPLKQAVLDRIVKRPMRGIAKIAEAKSDHASVRYEGFLVAAVERWKEYVGELRRLGKKPILFVMLTSTDDAEDVADWLRRKYPEVLGGDKTLVIHTDKTGEVSKTDLEAARKLARDVDEETSPVAAIVSVLMLREGWDVQNVTVVLGLRPFNAKAKVLSEQAIGRGLRLMFRGQSVAGYEERVDIIGTPKFLELVEDLERIEDVKLGTFEIGKDHLRIVTILPVAERAAFDIGLPTLSPVLVRKRSLAEEIAALDVGSLRFPTITVRANAETLRKFQYEAIDVVTFQKLIDREYVIPEPQTAEEVVGYYARRIAEQAKLPAHFAAIAPKVKMFFAERAFGRPVDLTDKAVIRDMASPYAHYVTVKTFGDALRAAAIVEKPAELVAPDRLLSSALPFPWSSLAPEARKTVFNLVACDNAFEQTFARFLDAADDVAAFAKLPQRFDFSIEYLDDANNLRMYHPDFVAIAVDGSRWLLETKGQESAEVRHKDRAAALWCENASTLSSVRWAYRKVPQKDFEALAPSRLCELDALNI